MEIAVRRGKVMYCGETRDIRGRVATGDRRCQWKRQTTAIVWSWRTGEVLEDSRIANVTPVFMKGKKEDPGNYRPVSPLSLERCWNIQNDFCFLSSILQRFDSQTGDAALAPAPNDFKTPSVHKLWDLVA
ncbi:uncharacterized protein [Anas acuta]|uniref:uncharacterized protein isoform X4 n=1 Tax=Anas acuta TaxID=28680 RepID=UPI0035C9418D